jgi:demethylsterigmatocystin 6-O-methyltransferase
MRRIMHDYPDQKCVAILQNLISALDQDSRILIDEMVLPNFGVHWQATQADLTMMAQLGSKERTREQWDVLIQSAGLKIVDIHTYNPSLQNSIIVVVPK